MPNAPNLKLPRRVRQHVLEDLSFSAFRTAKPENWAFREKSVDYGIDGEVEIFDLQGKTTGQVFLVQLRATDSPRSRSAAVRLEVRTYNYFRSLALPVLILRWVEPERALYYVWAHSLDPTPVQRSRSTFSVHFLPDNRFDATSAKKIEQSVSDYLSVFTTSLRLPICIDFKIEVPSRHVEKAAEAIGELRNISRAKHLPLSFSEMTEPPRVQLYLREKEIRASLGGVPGAVLDLAPNSWQDPTQFLAPHVLVPLLVITLAQARQSQAALQLCLSDLELIARCKLEALLIGVLKVLASNYRLDAAFKLMKLIGVVSPALQVHFYSYLMLTASRAPEHVVSQFVDGMTALASDTSSPSAPAEYNLGNLYLNRANYTLALHHLLRASKLDPTYRKRDYYFRDLGAVYFELGHTKKALRAYSKAKSLGDDGNIDCVIADCLFLLGRFDEARRLFGKGLRAIPSESMKWGLKLYLLNYVARHLGYKVQKRRKHPLVDIARFEQATSVQDILRIVVPVFDRDVLTPWAWFNLGRGAARFKNYDLAELAFLMAAVLRGKDPEAWSNTFISAINGRAPALRIAMIVKEAYRICGEEFVVQVRKSIAVQPRSQTAVDELDRLLSALANGAYDLTRDYDLPKMIRIIRPDGENYIEIPLHKGKEMVLVDGKSKRYIHARRKLRRSA
jgi:tetratricopeptide (TPR) repeat protein